VTLTDTTGTITFGGALTATTLTTAAQDYNLELNGGGTITNAVTFKNTGNLTLGDAVGDTTAFTNGVTATAPSQVNIAGTISSGAGKGISLGSTVVTDDATIDGNASTVGLSATTVNDGKTLTLGSGDADAITVLSISGTGGTSNVTFNSTDDVAVTGAIGGGIGTLKVTQSGGVTFGDTVGAATVTLTDTTGTITFGGALTATTLTTAAQDYNLELNGGGTITNAVTFKNTGNLTLGDAVGDTTAFTNGVTATAPSQVNIAGTISSGAGKGISLGSTVVTDDATIDGNASTVGLSATTVNDGKTLTLGSGDADAITVLSISGTGGTSNVTFNSTDDVAVTGAIGGGIGTLKVTQSGGVTFGDTVGAATVTLTDTTGTITFGGALTATTLTTAAQDYNLELNGGATITNAVTFKNTGALTLGDAVGDTTTFTGGVTATAPSQVNIAGTVAATDNAITIGDAGTPIVLTDDVTLDAGKGSITLGPVGAEGAATGENLTLKAGTDGDIVLGAIGAPNALGRLTVTNSKSTTFTDDITVNLGTGTVDLKAGSFVGLSHLTTVKNLTIETTSSDLDLPTLTLSGDLYAKSSGEITQSGALSVSGTLSGAADTKVTLGGANTITNLGAFTSDGAFTLNDGGGLKVTGAVDSGSGLAHISTSGTLAVAAGGSVTGTGVTLDATGVNSDITLAGDVDAGTGTATLNAGRAISRSAGVVSGDTVTLQSVTDIGANLSRVSIDATTLNATTTGANNDMYITPTAALANATISTNNGDVTISGGGRSISFVESGTLAASGLTDLSFTNTGDSVTIGAVTLTGALTVTSTSNDITLSNAISLASTSAMTLKAGNDITVNNGITNTGTGGLNLWAGGDVALNAAVNLAGGALSVAGTTGGATRAATFTAGASGTITTKGGNDIDGGAVKIATSGAISTQAITTSGGTATIKDGSNAGNITLDSSASTVTVHDTILALGSAAKAGSGGTGGDGGTVLITSNGDISIAGAIRARAGNAAVGGLMGDEGSLTLSAGGSVLQSAGDIQVGTLSMTAANGSIHQSGTATMNVSGLTTVEVDTSGSDILLAATANNFTGGLTLEATNAPNIRDLSVWDSLGTAALPINLTSATKLRNLTLVYDNAAIELPELSVSGNLNLTAGGAITTSGNISTTKDGNIDLTSTGKAITLSNDVTADGAGNVTIGAAGLLTVNSKVSSTTGDLSLTGDTGVTHNAAGDLSTGGAGTIGVTATNNDITMADGTVYTADTGTVTLQAMTDVKLGRITGNGTVNVTAAIGTITDNTAGSGAGNENVAADQVMLSGRDGIGASLKRVETAAGTLAAKTESGVVYVRETDQVTLNDVSGVANVSGFTDVYDLIAGGKITVSGTVNTTGSGNTVLESLANDIAIGANVGNSDGSTTLTSAGNITRSAGTVTGTDVTLDATGGIGSIASPVVTASTGTLTLTSGGDKTAGDISVTESNALSTSRVSLTTAGTAQTITINDSAVAANAITVDGKIGNSTDSITLNAIASNIKEGAGTVTGNIVTLIGDSGVGTDGDNRVNTDAATLAASSTTSGGVYVSEFDGVILNGTNIAVGDYDVTAAGTITVSGAVNDGVNKGNTNLISTSGGNIAVGANVGNVKGDTSLTSAGNITRSAGTVTGADLTLDAAGGIGSIASPVVTASTGTLTLTSDGDKSAGDISVTESNALATSRVALTTAGTAQTITINDSAVAANAITVDGKIGNSTDSITLNASASNIKEGLGTVTGSTVTLIGNKGVGTDSGHRVNTDAATLAASSTKSGGVFVSEFNGVILNGTNSAVGDYDVTAAGTITVSGAVNDGVNKGNTNLTAGSGNIVVNANVGNETGATTLTSAGTITGSEIVTGSTVTLTGPDGIGTDVANLRVITPILNASSTTAGTGDIYILAESDIITDVTVSVNNSDVILPIFDPIKTFDYHAGSLTSTALTNVTFTDTSNVGFAIGATSVSGVLNVTSGGTLTVSDLVNTAGGDGATKLTTTGSGNIVLGSILGNSGSDVTLTSAGNITGGGTVTGKNVILDSATGVGTDGDNRVNTAAGTLAARATAGDVYVDETDGVTLDTVNGVTNSADGAYDLTAGGDMAIDNDVESGTSTTLTSTKGNITGSGWVIGESVTLSSKTGIGDDSKNPLTVDATTLNVSSTDAGADLYLYAVDDYSLENVTASVNNSTVNLEIESGSSAFDYTGNTLTSEGLTDVTFTDTSKVGVSVGAMDLIGALTVNSGGALTLTDTINAGSVDLTGSSGININTTSITTSGGSQVFHNDVTLGANVTLDTTDGAAGGANITLQAVNADKAGSNRTLTLNAGTKGTISVNGAIGHDQALDTLEVVNSAGATFGNTVDAGTVKLTDTTGTIAFNGALTAKTLQTANAGYNVALNAGGTITDAVTFLNTGTVKLGNDVSDDLTFSGGVETSGNASNPSKTILAGTISSDGTDITFGATTLTAATTLNSNDGNIGFDSTVDGTGFGTENLTVNAGAGDITFNNEVGKTAPLGAMALNSTGTTTFGSAVGAASVTTDADGTTILHDDVTTGGVQSYGDDVTLANDVTLATTGAALTGANITLQAVNADDAANDRVLTLNAGTKGTITVNSAIGSSEALAGLTLTNSAGATFDATVEAGTVTLTDTTGTIAFNGALTTTTLNTANKGYNVALNAGGTITDYVEFKNTGSVTLGDGALDDLTFNGGFNTTASKTTSLAGKISTSGVNKDMDLGATILTAATTLTSNGGDVTFASTLDGTGFGTENLTVNAGAGDITFNGEVGNTSPVGAILLNSAGTTIFAGPVGALSVTTDAGGTTIIGDDVTTGGVQSYGDNVTLTNEVTLSSTGLAATGANITLQSVDADSADKNRTLTLDAGTEGTITVNGAVGSTEGLAALEVVNSAGAKFGDTVNVGLIKLTDTTGTIAFNGALTARTLTTTNMGYNVKLNAGGTITDAVTFLNTGTVTLGNDVNDVLNFTGGVGTADNKSNPNNTKLAGTITSTGANITLGATTLTAATTLNANSNGVKFTSTVNGTGVGTENLTVTAGSATFGAAVGGSTKLGNLTLTLANAGVDFTSVNLAGNLTADVSGTMTQKASSSLNVGGTTVLSAMRSGSPNTYYDITLNNSNNDFGGSVSVYKLGNAGAQNVKLNDLNSLTLGMINTTGSITATAAGGSLIIGNPISSTGGTVSLTGDSVQQLDNITTGGSGAVTVTANKGAITMSDGTKTTTASGNIGYSASGAVALSKLISTAGTISVTAGGAITDATKLDGSGNENISGVTVTLSAGTGIGDSTAAGDIDTAATTLSSSTTTGGIYITETNAVALGTTKTTGSGDIVITAGGTMTTSGNISTAGNGSINLSTSGTSSGINLSNSLIADGTGNVTLNASGLLTVNNLVSSTKGNLNLTGGSSVTHNAAGDLSTGGSGTINVTATTGSITMADGTGYSAGGGAVTLTAGNGVALGSITNGSGAVSVTATGGTITDATAGEGSGNENITGGAVTLLASKGIGESTDAGDIDTSAETLTSTAAINGIYIAEKDGVTVGATKTTTGGSIEITAGGVMRTSGNISTAGNGHIELRTTSGGMTVSNTVTAAGAGYVSLHAAGALTVNNAVGSTTGNLTLKGDSVSQNAAGDLTTSGTGTIDVTARTGDITMVDGTVYTAGGGEVTLTAANNIALARISNASGAVSMHATAGAITDVTAGEGSGNENIVGSTVMLGAGTGVGSSSAAGDIDTAAATLSSSTATGGIYFAETNDVAVGGMETTTSGDIVVAAVGAITTSGDISTKGNGNITLNAINGGLALSNSVTANGTGNVLLTSTGDITRTAGTVTGNDVTLIAAGGIGSNASPVVTASTGTLHLESAGAGRAGDIAVTEGNALATSRLSLTTAASAQMVTINDSATGDAITVDGSIGNATDSITLNATAGKITGGAVISGNIVALGGATGVGASGSAVKTTATTLASSSVTGGIYIAETDGVALGATSTTTSGNVVITAGGAMTTSGDVSTAGNGSIDLSTTSGAVTVSNAVTANGSGNVTLNAAGLLTVNNAVGSTSGNLSLKGGTGVTHNAAGDLTTGGAGTIGVTATTGDISMASGTVYTAGTGDITLQAASNVNLGLATTDGNVSVTATSGSIVDNGTGSESIVGQTVSLVTGGTGTIGSAAQVLNIDGEVLNAQTSGTNIYVTDLSGGVGVGLVTTGGVTAGDVTLAATNGSITESGADSAADIVGKTLNLSVTGASSSIGLASNPIEINTDVLNASTQGGGIWLTDVAGGVNVGLVNAGGTTGGTVVLIANDGGIFDSGSNAAGDIVGSDVTIDITGATPYDLGTSDNMVEIGAQILRLGNTSGGAAYFDMNGTAGSLPGHSLPAGLILDEAHLPRLIVCGTQVIGGEVTDSTTQVNHELSSIEIILPNNEIVPSGGFFSPPEQGPLFSNGDSMTLDDGEIE
jgi:hypothetical protein